MRSPPHRRRVASLLPAATEIVCALGARESLMGISHECDFPAGLQGLPVLTRARGSPGIRGLAVYSVDVEALARAAPDLILTQDLCDVCAVSLPEVEAAARSLGNPDVEIVSLRPTRLPGILDDFATVGAALGRESQARALVAASEARIEAVRRRALGLPRPSVLTIEWLDPVMVGGLWMPELVELAGGLALVAEPGDHAPTLTQEELARLAPDVVVVKPCGFRLARTREEFSRFSPALRAGSVWLADGSAYFNRPGPRIVDSLEILAACIHPDHFADFAAQHARGFEAAFPVPARDS